jgi:hypothetical protein
MAKIRPRITQEEWEIVKIFRAESPTKNYTGINQITDGLDIDNTTVKHLWVKNKTASLFVKNPNFISPEELEQSNFKDELIEDLKNYSPKFPKLERIENKDSYLLVLDPADIHIGKLCTSFESGETDIAKGFKLYH